MVTNDELKTKLERSGQIHLFNFIDELNKDEKSRLVEQVKSIDFDLCTKLFNEPPKTGAVDIKPPKLIVEEVESQWRDIGIDCVRRGKVAVVTLAGGQGTRLGSLKPKGCFDIGVPELPSLFHIQAECIRRVALEAGRAPLWMIMTSPATFHDTVEFFRINGNFGLEPPVFFNQEMLPAFSPDGKIFMSSKSSVALSPSGNGGFFKVIDLAFLEQKGIEYVHVYCVDNCLVKVADPTFIGCCVEKKIDCGSKSVQRVDPNESVGLFALDDNGRLMVKEYSEISPKDRTLQLENGELLFKEANIANHFFTLSFLKKVCNLEPKFHIAKKKIPAIDVTTGKILDPPPIGIKFEAFIFDVFEHAENPLIFRVERDSEFAPLKNASGPDSPQTCLQNYLKVKKIDKS